MATDSPTAMTMRKSTAILTGTPTGTGMGTGTGITITTISTPGRATGWSPSPSG